MRRKGTLLLVLCSLVLMLVAPVAYGDPVNPNNTGKLSVLVEPMGHGHGGY